MRASKGSKGLCQQTGQQEDSLLVIALAASRQFFWRNTSQLAQPLWIQLQP